MPMTAREVVLSKYYRKIIESQGIFSFCSFGDIFRPQNREFSYAETLTAWERLLAALPRTEHRHLRLYVHIPYCSRRCSFCMYSSDVLSKSSEIDSYMGYLEDCFQYMSAMFRGIVFEEIYVGGGTPSLLTDTQITRVLSKLLSHYRISPQAQFTFEMNPRNVSPRKAAALKAAGCNRVSMGVQTLNPELLREVNRGGQTRAQISRAVDCLLAAGIEEINCDLLLGLGHDTPESLLDSIGGLLEIGPPHVNLYRIQQDLRLDYFNKNSPSAFARARNELEKTVANQIEILAGSRGYGVRENSSGFSFSRADRKFVNRAPMEDFNKIELGFGRFSDSFLNGGMEFRNISRNSSFDARDRSFSGVQFSAPERLANYALRHYNHHGHISLDRATKACGISAETLLGRPAAVLQESGRAKCDGDRIYLTAKNIGDKLADMLYLLDAESMSAVRNFRRIHKPL